MKEVPNGEILFLTNNDNTLELFHWLEERCKVTICMEKLELQEVKIRKPKLIICYNYNYIIKEDVIRFMQGAIINLHISYLPWNRGSSPNFWSFIDGTPKGVTIHQIDAELDKGLILYQRECEFDTEKETFETSYDKLNQMIVELFKEHWEKISSGDWKLFEIRGKGSYHSKKDLDKIMAVLPFEWSDNIAEFLNRYKEKMNEK